MTWLLFWEMLVFLSLGLFFCVAVFVTIGGAKEVWQWLRQLADAE